MYQHKGQVQLACIWRVFNPCIQHRMHMKKYVHKSCFTALTLLLHTYVHAIPTLPGAADVQRVNDCCGRSYTAMGIPSQVGLQMLEPNCLQNKKRDRVMHPQPLQKKQKQHTQKAMYRDFICYLYTLWHA